MPMLGQVPDQAPCTVLVWGRAGHRGSAWPLARCVPARGHRGAGAGPARGEQRTGPCPRDVIRHEGWHLAPLPAAAGHSPQQGLGSAPRALAAPCWGGCSWGQVAHSTWLLPCSQLAHSSQPQPPAPPEGAARGSTPQSCKPAIHSTYPTGRRELEPHTAPEAPQCIGAVRAWSHHLVPVLRCSTEHCWAKEGCNCSRSCPPPHPSGLRRICLHCASGCTHLARAVPKARTAQTVRGEDGAGRTDSESPPRRPCWQSPAGASSMGTALASWVGLQQRR